MSDEFTKGKDSINPSTSNTSDIDLDSSQDLSSSVQASSIQPTEPMTPEPHDSTGTLAAANATDRMEEEAEALEKQQKKLHKTKRQMRAVQRFLFHAFLILFLIWIMFGVVFGILRMPSGDMSPRIDNGDLLMYYRLDRAYKADQVLVLEKNDTTYVGRVVAVSGDTVEITDQGKLLINGNAVVEKWVSGPTPRYEGFVEYPVTLGQDEYFVLSDVRDGGEDSRYYGVVKKSDVKGSVFSLFRRNHF